MFSVSFKFLFQFCTLLVITSTYLNAGEYSWQMQDSKINVSCRGIDVIDSQTAWISGGEGRFSRTTDGGNSWTPGQVASADSFDFRDIAVFGKTVYLMAAGTGEKARIYKSIDDGTSWTLQFVNPYPAGFFSGIAFQDSLNGLILSDPVHGKYVLFITNDGGKNWLQLNPEAAPTPVDGEYAFAASGSCIISGKDGNYWFASGGTTARVFASSNHGKTWQVSKSAIISGLPSTGIFSLALRDNQYGLAAGGDYANPDSVCTNLQISKDGGTTWKSLQKAGNLGFLSSVAWINFKDEDHILACGSDTSAIMNLQGEVVVNLKRGFHAIGTSPDGKHFWATGSEGRVARLVLN